MSFSQSHRKTSGVFTDLSHMQQSCDQTSEEANITAISQELNTNLKPAHGRGKKATRLYFINSPKNHTTMGNKVRIIIILFRIFQRKKIQRCVTQSGNIQHTHTHAHTHIYLAYSVFFFVEFSRPYNHEVVSRIIFQSSMHLQTSRASYNPGGSAVTVAGCEFLSGWRKLRAA